MSRGNGQPIHRVFLHAPVLLFSGPNVEVLPDLFGDHQWHFDIGKLTGWLEERRYKVTYERIGMSEPFCELFVAAWQFEDLPYGEVISEAVGDSA